MDTLSRRTFLRLASLTGSCAGPLAAFATSTFDTTSWDSHVATIADGKKTGEDWRVTKAKCFAALALREAM